VCESYLSGCCSVDPLGGTGEPTAFLRFWACGLSPVHPANRFAFHRRRSAPHTAALGFGRALIAVVLAKDQDARLAELGKSGFHVLSQFHLAQDPLHLQLNWYLGVFIGR